MRRDGLRAVNKYSEMARRLSYAEIMDVINGKLKRVYETLVLLKSDYKEGVSSEQIAIHLGVGIHTISPRIGELSDLGLIQETGMGKNESGKKCALWSPVKSDLQYNFNYTRDDIICHK